MVEKKKDEKDETTDKDEIKKEDNDNKDEEAQVEEIKEEASKENEKVEQITLKQINNIVPL